MVPLLSISTMSRPVFEIPRILVGCAVLYAFTNGVYAFTAWQEYKHSKIPPIPSTNDEIIKWEKELDKRHSLIKKT